MNLVAMTIINPLKEKGKRHCLGKNSEINRIHSLGRAKINYRNSVINNRHEKNENAFDGRNLTHTMCLDMVRLSRGKRSLVVMTPRAIRHDL